MPAPARVAALRALLIVDDGQTTVGDALARTRNRLADRRDRALATEIVTGTLRWQAALDFLIERASGRALDRLDVGSRSILRSGAFQLLHLARVPASAVVNDSVDLAKAGRRPGSASFINAVLRRIVRDGAAALPPRPPELALPRPGAAASAASGALLDYLSITLSHPRWLVARWVERFGAEEAEKMATFNNVSPRATLRPNVRVTSSDALRAAMLEDHVVVEPSRFAPGALTVVGGHPTMERERAGEYWIQDESSQLVAFLVDVTGGGPLLDLCASPGGKSLITAERAGIQATIVSADSRRRRLELLRDTLGRFGASNVRVVGLDGTRSLPFRRPFSSVLVDAPCSGLATIRRDPEVRWRRHPNDFPDLVRRQLALLTTASSAVAPGGQLVYATCSSEPEENQWVVDRFLDAAGVFAREEVARVDSRMARDLFDASGDFQPRPNTHGLEAFFAARLRRLR